MTHNIKHSVSVAIRSVDSDGSERVVAVLRPDAPDDPLGGLWGLPAATLRNDETADGAATRILRDKLGLHVTGSEHLLKITQGQRAGTGDAVQTMSVYAAQWNDSAPLPISLPPLPDTHDEEPAGATITLYEAWRWVTPDELDVAAQRGSLCTRLYLEWLNKREPFEP